MKPGDSQVEIPVAVECISGQCDGVDPVFVDQQAALQHESLPSDGEADVEHFGVGAIEVREDLAKIAFEEQGLNVIIPSVSRVATKEIAALEDSAVALFLIQRPQPDEHAFGAREVQLSEQVETAGPFADRSPGAAVVEVVDPGPERPKDPDRRSPDCSGRQFDSRFELTGSEELFVEFQQQGRSFGDGLQADRVFREFGFGLDVLFVKQFGEQLHQWIVWSADCVGERFGDKPEQGGMLIVDRVAVGFGRRFFGDGTGGHRAGQHRRARGHQHQ